MGFFHNNFLNDNYKRKILNSCWRWLNFIHFSHLFSQWGHLHCKNVSPPQYSNRNTVLGSNGHRKHICRTSHIQHLYSFEALLASNHGTYSTFLHLQCLNAVAITCFWPFILWQNWNSCSADKTNIELLEFLESFASSLGQWGSVEEAVWGWLEDGWKSSCWL